MTYSVKVPRIMIAAAGSGSGKTTITCGLLQAFLNRGLKMASFKCGPDYIDPMFHSEVLGIPSRNLDLFFTDEPTTRFLMARAASKAFAEGAEPREEETRKANLRAADLRMAEPRNAVRREAGQSDHCLAVIEGVMGYYDGLAAISTEASSYDLARATETPAVLLVDCKGKSVSILAEIKGFLEYKADSQIKGVLLNRLSAMLYPDLKRMIEEELGITAYGYIPIMKECGLESRHLGLVTAKEVGNLKEIVGRLAAQMAETVDLDGLIQLSKQAPELTVDTERIGELKAEPGTDTGSFVTASAAISRMDPFCSVGSEPASMDRPGSASICSGGSRPRIGIASDKAFCFYYQDNLELLEELGAELVPFSPLFDGSIPEDLSGLIFGGGYPELYLERLAENWPLLEEIRFAIEAGMPCFAECGGFMYLHEWIADKSGNRFPMVGAVEGESFPTGKLGRFGYITLTAKRDTLLCRAGETVRGHEFHYWDSTNTGDSCQAKKPLRSRTWDCVLTDGKKTAGNLFAGYPHIHFWSNPQTAARFVQACCEWREKNK